MIDYEKMLREELNGIPREEFIDPINSRFNVGGWMDMETGIEYLNAAVNRVMLKLIKQKYKEEKQAKKKQAT